MYVVSVPPYRTVYGRKDHRTVLSRAQIEVYGYGLRQSRHRSRTVIIRPYTVYGSTVYSPTLAGSSFSLRISLLGKSPCEILCLVIYLKRIVGLIQRCYYSERLPFSHYHHHSERAFQDQFHLHLLRKQSCSSQSGMRGVQAR